MMNQPTLEDQMRQEIFNLGVDGMMQKYHIGSKTVHKLCISDNGLEFVDLHSAINSKSLIELHRTHPYTPQKNGKIERWWETLERSKKLPLREPYLSYLAQQYNDTC